MAEEDWEAKGEQLRKAYGDVTALTADDAQSTISNAVRNWTQTRNWCRRAARSKSGGSAAQTSWAATVTSGATWNSGWQPGTPGPASYSAVSSGQEVVTQNPMTIARETDVVIASNRRAIQCMEFLTAKGGNQEDLGFLNATGKLPSRFTRD
ncbi:hypothetical protein I317_02222 [Kwoniella heveanensis CBS 569]|nr:hypothetical protein I317_02222 [Kwoniella heveanensis CBS 569]